MTLTKRRPVATVPRFKSRSKQRVISALPLRLKQTRSFTWVVLEDAMNGMSDSNTNQPTTPVEHLTFNSSNNDRQSPRRDLLFRYVERVSLQKLSKTNQHVLSSSSSSSSSPDTDTVDAAISTPQTPSSLSTLSMRHGQRRWCLVRQCLTKSRAFALSREMQQKEVVDLERLGMVNTELTHIITQQGELSKNYYQEEMASAKDWWGPFFSEEQEALNLWTSTVHEMKQRQIRRQRAQQLPASLCRSIPTMTAGGSLSTTVYHKDTFDKSRMDKIVKPLSPPQSPPAIESHSSGMTAVLG